jgi:hypothetical protein
VSLVPKSGPFKSLAFRTPTPEVEKLFMASFNATIDSYRILLANVDAGGLAIPNENFDMGRPTLAGEYLGVDVTYDKLLGKLADHNFAATSPGLRNNILSYYKDRKPPTSPPTKKASAEWAKLAAEREQLEQVELEEATTR